jgi:U32 family peptidase
LRTYLFVFREAVTEVKNAKKIAIVATPRILKPDEQRLWTFYLRLKADALLVRSSGFLQQMLALGGSGAYVNGTNSTIPLLYGDFSLNVANIPSAKIYLSAGLSRLAPTHDLNADQIADLVNGIGLKSSGMIECIIHQHLPIFHTEHCVFCRFLSDGNNYKDCGHPCETNNVDLRDLNGKDHIVLADMGCRNTVFNAEAQSGALYIKTLMDAGVKKFRIELVDEDEKFVEPMLNKYRDLTLCENENQLEQKLESLLLWLRKLPNRNGLSQGVGVGSLKPTEETDWETMKPTAYQIKAAKS